MRKTLIYHKKKMYYLLSNIREKALLHLLEQDMELTAELEYKKYMDGEQ